jgi:hypothetical protein
LLRYVKRYGPVTKFTSFVQGQNRTADGLASLLKQELAAYNFDKTSLLCQMTTLLPLVEGKIGLKSR